MMNRLGKLHPPFIIGELFCGAGGLTRGFHSVGFKSVFANDAWPLALHTYMMNFDSAYARTEGNKSSEVVPVHGSVEDIDVANLMSRVCGPKGRIRSRELDVLVGGPPCQGYSVNSHIRSGSDPRNYLFKHYIRILKGLSPKVFLLENVPGMLSLDGGRFMDELLHEVEQAGGKACPGYEVRYKILNAAHYGVPQERFRLVIVGTRLDVIDRSGVVDLPLPEHYSLSSAHFKGGRTHTFHHAIGFRRRLAKEDSIEIGGGLLPPMSVSDAIDDLPFLPNGGGADIASYEATRPPVTEYQRKMREKASILRNHWCRALVGPNVERVKHVPANGDWRDIPHDLLSAGMQRALRKDHTKRYGRLNPSELSGTILTKPDPHWGTFIHYDQSQQRLISVREAARIQSFPDRHIFYGSQVDQYKLCGNAVPPLLAEAIAAKIQAVLSDFSGKEQADDQHVQAISA